MRPGSTEGVIEVTLDLDGFETVIEVSFADRGYTELYEQLVKSGEVTVDIPASPFDVPMDLSEARPVARELLEDNAPLSTIPPSIFLDPNNRGYVPEEILLSWMRSHRYPDEVVDAVLRAPFVYAESNYDSRKVYRGSFEAAEGLGSRIADSRSYLYGNRTRTFTSNEAILELIALCRWAGDEQNSFQHAEHPAAEYSFTSGSFTEFLQRTSTPVVRQEVELFSRLFHQNIRFSAITVAETATLLANGGSLFSAMGFFGNGTFQNAPPTDSPSKKIRSMFNRRERWLDQMREAGAGVHALCWLMLFSRIDSREHMRGDDEQRLAKLDLILQLISAGVPFLYAKEVLTSYDVNDAAMIINGSDNGIAPELVGSLAA